jgi:hypothetical protein
MVPGDRVELVNSFGRLPVGSVGVVKGFYRRPDGELVALVVDGRLEIVPNVYLQVMRSHAGESRFAAG